MSPGYGINDGEHGRDVDTLKRALDHFVTKVVANIN